VSAVDLSRFGLQADDIVLTGRVPAKRKRNVAKKLNTVQMATTWCTAASAVASDVSVVAKSVTADDESKLGDVGASVAAARDATASSLSLSGAGVCVCVCVCVCASMGVGEWVSGCL
jgi:ABC-type Fe3+ transport system permease subunit